MIKVDFNVECHEYYLYTALNQTIKLQKNKLLHKSMGWDLLSKYNKVITITNFKAILTILYYTIQSVCECVNMYVCMYVGPE